jgi:hypothetical protein
MSRSGYTYDMDDQWQLIRWRGAVASALNGRRGQDFLKEMLAALDKIEDQRLISGDLVCEGEVCALGAVGLARHLEMADIDPEDRDTVADFFGVAHAMACEIMYENDEGGSFKETNEERYVRMRCWVINHLKPENR